MYITIYSSLRFYQRNNADFLQMWKWNETFCTWMRLISKNHWRGKMKNYGKYALIISSHKIEPFSTSIDFPPKQLLVTVSNTGVIKALTSEPILTLLLHVYTAVIIEQYWHGFPPHCALQHLEHFQTVGYVIFFIFPFAFFTISHSYNRITLNL